MPYEPPQHDFPQDGQPAFAPYYAQLGEPELLTLARAYDSLTEPAQSALRAEFSKRRLEPPTIDEPEPAAAARSLITLRRYRDLSEAIVARSLLESAGIVVYLRDENLIRLDWQLSNFIGGIRLQVEAEDVASATELLDQPIPETISFEGPFDSSKPDSSKPDSSKPEFDQPHCPRCGSLELTFEGASRAAQLSSLFVLGLPLPAGPKSWLCNTCQARWEDSETAAP